MDDGVRNGGCCIPTTSSASSLSSSNSITVVNGVKSRGIVHSMTESGTARLIFNEDFTHLRGALLNECEESISITGATTSAVTDSVHDILISDENKSKKTLRRLMTLSMVDGEVGQKFVIWNVEVRISSRNGNSSNSNGMDEIIASSPQLCLEINHVAIKFRTTDVFIGNRADIEIQKYLGPMRLMRANSRSNSSQESSSLEERSMNALYVGPMSINVVTCERTEPTMRRLSVCDGCATKIIEQSNDFLV